jgi:hypothetical protein
MNARAAPEKIAAEHCCFELKFLRILGLVPARDLTENDTEKAVAT